ncbi:MAG TPA: phosphonate C-P lyase system protein PhnG [Pseudoflavonifractor sp.]|nr:phosphonate C-P lyase system protein PhnG [Pseudoflavonifractor sp.]
MEKKRLSKILARADRELVAGLSAEIRKKHGVTVIKEPGKTLTMIKVREPVKQSLFYLGEVIVCEAVVELDGVKGMAVTMGDDTDKTLDMAIIDAAVNRGVFTGMETLLALEEQQRERIMRENALHMKTMVNFESMDGEAPSDVAAFKKT